MTRKLIVALSLFAVIGLAVLFAALPAAAEPTIRWNPNRVEETLQPGQTRTIETSFTALADVPSAILRVATSVAPYITVQPSSIGPVSMGQTVPVRLTILVPFSAATGTCTGTIQVLSEGRPRHRIARHLPIVVEVTEHLVGRVTAGGMVVSFSAPDGWSVINDASAGVSNLFGPTSAERIDAGDAKTPPDVAISVVENADRLPLPQFAQTYRDGKFVMYAASRTEAIAGSVALVVDDEASEVPFEPHRAALIPFGESVVVVAAYDMDSSDFDRLLASAVLN